MVVSTLLTSKEAGISLSWLQNPLWCMKEALPSGISRLRYQWIIWQRNIITCIYTMPKFWMLPYSFLRSPQSSTHLARSIRLQLTPHNSTSHRDKVIGDPSPTLLNCWDLMDKAEGEMAGSLIKGKVLFNPFSSFPLLPVMLTHAKNITLRMRLWPKWSHSGCDTISFQQPGKSWSCHFQLWREIWPATEQNLVQIFTFLLLSKARVPASCVRESKLFPNL